MMTMLQQIIKKNDHTNKQINKPPPTHPFPKSKQISKPNTQANNKTEHTKKPNTNKQTNKKMENSLKERSLKRRKKVFSLKIASDWEKIHCRVN